MADNFTRVGYGQVEPNQLSAQKTGQIYARLPLDKEVNVLQNGEFMYYDYANGTVNCGKSKSVPEGTVATMGEPMLVFNEIKLYEPFYKTSYKDFAMIRVGENYVTSRMSTNGPITPQYGGGAETVGVVVDPAHTEYPYRMSGFAPRLFKTNVGDIYTTNMVKAGDGETTVTYAIGDLLVPVKNTSTKTLQLEKFTATQQDPAPTGMAWSVVQVYTMPDGQPGLKLQRVQ